MKFILGDNKKENKDERGKYTLLDFKLPDDFFCPICINTLQENKKSFLDNILNLSVVIQFTINVYMNTIKYIKKMSIV